MMDSGAAKHVTNRGTVPHVPIVPSPGSLRNQSFISATGGRSPNEGEQHLQGCTDAGTPVDMNIQITDVNKSLFSVAEITERGNRVIFGRGGGVIHNVKSNRLTPFRRTGGVYALDIWIPKEPCKWGFGGQE